MSDEFDELFTTATATENPRPWLLDAADLLAEPDPGPTQWLVEDLIVDKAVVAVVGRWKTTKSYGLLHTCIAVATGQPAFGAFEIPAPGPVVFLNEESGRDALWRRLDALCRGRAIDPETLRGQLHVGANAGIKLDDPRWQSDLIELGKQLKPRLFVFDPFARMKASARAENDQTDMAVLIEYLRLLRDETQAAVCFVHHTGHTGEHMRGSSDLESMWESRLTWTRDGQSPTITVSAEHREAEAAEPFTYRINWDSATRSMRFDAQRKDNADSNAPTLQDRILEGLREHPNQRADELAKLLSIRTSDVRRELYSLVDEGKTKEGPSGRTDSLGRPIQDKVWNLNTQAGLWVVPQDGPRQDEPRSGLCGVPEREDPRRGSSGDEPPDEVDDGGGFGGEEDFGF
jgi:AAA domain